MVSAVDLAKRALVSLVKTLSAIYGLSFSLTRDSLDAAVRTAYRKLSRKTHPDHGGNLEHQKALNAAHDAWEEAARNSKSKRGGGRQSNTTGPPAAAGLATVLPVWEQRRKQKEYRFQSVAVLLTYQKFADAGVWKRFVQFVREHVLQWKVWRWCATMETNSDGTYHTHLVFQFLQARNRTAQNFAFDGVCPNARPNDLLGEGWCGKRLQQSVDRAFFYVWANKEGTERDENGGLCVAGNYEPAWTGAKYNYPVAGTWLDKLLKAYKLSLDTYEEYLYLCRDGIPHRKRNLDAVRARRDELALKREIEERTKRIRNSPALYQPFKTVPEAEAWLALFQQEALRRPLLLAHAPSYTGKTEWANSLFKQPLELKVGALTHFPEGMRRFDRSKFDGLVLDDVRDLSFLVEHQEKLQGKYNTEVEFGSTTGGTCAFFRDLYRVPVVVTVNNSTRNLNFLSTNDFLSKKENVHFLSFSGRPGEAPPKTSWP